MKCATCGEDPDDDALKRQMAQRIQRLERERDQYKGEWGVLKAVLEIMSKGKEKRLIDSVYQQGVNKYYEQRSRFDTEYWKDFDDTTNSIPAPEDTLPRSY